MSDDANEQPMNKQQLRTQRSTNALLEAAADLIVEGGFAASPSPPSASVPATAEAWSPLGSATRTA